MHFSLRNQLRSVLIDYDFIEAYYEARKHPNLISLHMKTHFA